MRIHGMALVGALALAPLANADERLAPPVQGDPVNGGRVFRLHCASCHGIGAEGDGPLAKGLATKPANLRDGSTVWARTSSELVAAISPANQKKDAPPMHGRGLNELELRDVVEWLREPVPTLESFFPAASDYVAHKQTFDEFGVERAEKALGRELKEGEGALMLYAMFKPEAGEDGKTPPPPPGGPKKVPEDAPSLNAAKPRRKIGFVGFVPVKIDGASFQVAVGLDRGMRLVKVATVPTGDEKSDAARRKLEPTLVAFEGSGGNVDKKPVEPQKKTVKASKETLGEMQRAYVLVLEAAAMYAKEEKDRFWADPDAFKFPAAAEMEDVKFDFKEKKSK